MADQPAAGRGQGDSKSGKKLKFAPTVPSRRKKAEEGAGASSAADAAAANEAFQDLIRAAQSESKWERGRGRGFGRGRGMMGAQNVTFGGGDDSGRRPGVAPPAARIPGIKQLVGTSSSAAAKKELKSKLKSDPSKVDATKPSTRFFDGADDGDSDEDEDAAANTFNFNQYFPSTLPLSLHHPEDDAADPDSDALLMRQGVPEDLALRQDDPEHSVQQLGLADLSAAQDYIYLFQLPAALPLAVAPKQQEAADPQRGKRAAAANGSSSSNAAAVGLHRAAGVKELPSGKVGKLLLFRSGKVKMQIGDVLLDVSPGVPCVTRQEVAAINASAKMLVNLGPVTQRAVVCPDVWQLMADQDVPDWQRAAAVKQRQRLGGAAEAAAEHAQLHAAAAANGKAAVQDGSGSMGVGSEDHEQQQQAGSGKDNDLDGADGMSEDDANVDESDGIKEKLEQGKSDKDSGSGESSSEDDNSSSPEESPPAVAVKQEPPKAAAAASNHDDEVMTLLGLPTAAAAASGGSRGRGRFRPAASRPVRGVKKE